MSQICLYYRKPPDLDRWFKGDRLIRPYLRRLLRGKPAVRGLDKMFFNLCRGLDNLGIDYSINKTFDDLQDDDQVAVLGVGRYALEGYDKPNPVLAGIGLMNHPGEWLDLFDKYPVTAYLQHSEWIAEIYKKHFGDRCRIWPVGIDTVRWTPVGKTQDLDILIYDKILWDRDIKLKTLLEPIKKFLHINNIKYEVITYGKYTENQYYDLLNRSKALLFLCEHESQGIAYQECLSCDVPVLAWDQGWFLDPNISKKNETSIPATSVPYFDNRCGEKFTGLDDFNEKLELFMNRLENKSYHPRQYILENLTLEKSAKQFMDIMQEVNN